MSKGLKPGDAWDELLSLVLLVAKPEKQREPRINTNEHE
jgi:hypothetical protein